LLRNVPQLRPSTLVSGAGGTESFLCDYFILIDFGPEFDPEWMDGPVYFAVYVRVQRKGTNTTNINTNVFYIYLPFHFSQPFDQRFIKIIYRLFTSVAFALTPIVNLPKQIAFSVKKNGFGIGACTILSYRPTTLDD
jgi:hypothetical protein